MIAQKLEQLLSDPSFIVQVIQEDAELHIYINREPAHSIDESTLQHQVYLAVTTLPISNIQGIWLYSRILGMVDPDWQTYIALPQPTGLSTLDDLQESTLTSQSSPLSVVDTAAPVEHAIPSGSAASEAVSEVRSTQTQQTVPQDEVFQLSQYCFIRNRTMLTTELLPPSPDLAQLIQTFHERSEAEQRIALPNLDRFFRTAALPDITSLTPELQAWFNSLTALPSAERRKASIWFSRYCFNPEATLAIVGRVLGAIATPSEESEELEAADSEPAASEQPASNLGSPQVTPGKAAHSAHAPVTPQSSVRSQPVPSRQPTSPTPSRKKATKSIQITPWRAAIGLSIITLLMLTIIKQLTAPPSIAELCRQSSSQYCSLAVQLVGPSVLQQAAKQTLPLKEEMAGQGEAACRDVASGWMKRRSGLISATSQSRFETKSEEVLPGILLVDVQVQGAVAAPEDMPPRTACVFGNAKGQIGWLTKDEIPADWPNQAYEGAAIAESTQRSTTIYNILMLLGSNTLFTAVGLFVISMLGLSVQIYSLEALFQAAWLLGIVETCFAIAIPVFGIFGGIALESVAFLATSACVKEFKIDWSAGYRAVSIGVLVFMVIRWFLHFLLLLAIQAIL